MVIQGRRYVSASLAELLVNDLDTDANQPFIRSCRNVNSRSSARSQSASRFPISQRNCALSVKTVSTYRSRVLEKMSFANNADITSYALRNGLMQ